MDNSDFSQKSGANPFSKKLKQVPFNRNYFVPRNKVYSMLNNSRTPYGSPSTAQKSNNETDKRHQFRLKAIEETLISEKNYLNQLEKLMKYFIIPLKERAIINEHTHALLFRQIEMIYNLNGELVNLLEENLENIGNAFLKIAPFFKLYSVYAFDYKNSLFVIQDLIEKCLEFRRFLTETESRPEVQTKLNSLMIIPIQRVARYKLLLEQVLLYTSPADSDFKILKESVKCIEDTVSHINSTIEDQETTQTLMDLQNSLVNRIPNIVQPSRKVIKEGILSKYTRNGDQIQRYCVLMSDLFMYCKILKDRSKNTSVENSLECCCIFPLKKCKIYELFPGNFKISCQGDGLLLCSPDLQNAQNWIGSIRDTIDVHIECRKTLRKESSKRTPRRKNDVRYFDSNIVANSKKRKYDFETTYRQAIESDDESNSDDESKSKCFKIGKRIPNLLKRTKSEPYPVPNVEPTFKNSFCRRPPVIMSRPKYDSFIKPSQTYTPIASTSNLFISNLKKGKDNFATMYMTTYN